MTKFFPEYPRLPNTKARRPPYLRTGSSRLSLGQPSNARFSCKARMHDTDRPATARTETEGKNWHFCRISLRLRIFTITCLSCIYPESPKNPKVPGDGTHLHYHWLSASYLFFLFLYKTGTFGTLGLSEPLSLNTSKLPCLKNWNFCRIRTMQFLPDAPPVSTFLQSHPPKERRQTAAAPKISRIVRKNQTETFGRLEKKR